MGTTVQADEENPAHRATFMRQVHPILKEIDRLRKI